MGEVHTRRRGDRFDATALARSWAGRWARRAACWSQSRCSRQRHAGQRRGRVRASSTTGALTPLPALLLACARGAGAAALRAVQRGGAVRGGGAHAVVVRGRQADGTGGGRWRRQDRCVPLLPRGATLTLPGLPVFKDICPVFEGCAQAHAGRRVEYGGTDLDAALQESLRARHAPPAAARGVAPAEARLQRRERGRGHSQGPEGGARLCLRGAFPACQPVAPLSRRAQTADAFAECLAAPTAEAFALPDGRSFSAPRHALARSGELLFDPRAASVPRPGAGLTEEILSSVQLCISDQRRQMCVPPPPTGPLGSLTRAPQAGERGAVRRRAGFERSGEQSAQRAHRSLSFNRQTGTHFLRAWRPVPNV